MFFMYINNPRWNKCVFTSFCLKQWYVCLTSILKDLRNEAIIPLPTRNNKNYIFNHGLYYLGCILKQATRNLRITLHSCISSYACVDRADFKMIICWHGPPISIMHAYTISVYNIWYTVTTRTHLLTKLKAKLGLRLDSNHDWHTLYFSILMPFQFISACPQNSQI